jgi:hypothetical protein
MINGIEYCTVEITCEDVTQYGIQACGHEARASQEALGHYMLEPLACQYFLEIPRSIINAMELLTELWVIVS